VIAVRRLLPLPSQWTSWHIRGLTSVSTGNLYSIANIQGVFDKHEDTRLKKLFSRARTDQGQSIESIASDSQQTLKKFRYLNDDEEDRESNDDSFENGAQFERMRRVCYIENASHKTAMDNDVNKLFLCRKSRG